MIQTKKKTIKSIHFVGIKGVGMAPLAIIAKEKGLKVTGSDIGEEFITDEPLKKAGIMPLIGFSKDHIKNPDLVITTGAHGGFENIEVKEALSKEIRVITQGQAVGEFMEGLILNKKFEGISVAGSHGKTTSSAMLATVFKHCKLDPSFIIGTGNIPSLGSCGHLGRGKYFIAEADEYATEPNYDKTAKFLWQHPRIAIFTNIELDHPDLFPTIDSIRDAFLKFAHQLPSDGTLIVNGDDGQIKKLVKDFKGKVITFGKSPNNNFVLKRAQVSGEQTFFWVETGNTSLGEFVLSVVGEHNALNALSVIIASLECGLQIEDIKQALRKFTGSKRRFEYIGKLLSGALLFDDYAHHPTEIKKTLEAFKQSFLKHKIVCMFQPHTFSRTKILFEDFIHSFSNADSVLLMNIYPSLRESPDSSVSSGLLAEGIKRFHRDVVFLPEISNMVEYIKQKRFGRDTVLITMGAGDIYKVGEALKEEGELI